MCEIYKNLSLEDMQGEIWKDIEGYEGLYQISNMGRVKSLKNNKNKILKQHLIRKGYLQIKLYKDNRTKHFSTHRLVAQAFIPNLENKPQVNHINEIKTDNCVENLEWMTHLENNNYGTRNKRAKRANINGKLSKTVLQYDLDGNFIKEWKSTMDCMRNGYDQGCVAACCRGERRTHKGYIWKYKL